MYYDNQETFWSSQVLLTHQDKIYNSDGYLRISISSSTKDFTSFNPVLFGINIRNNLSKTCNLNIQNSSDLLTSISYVMKNIEATFKDNSFQILKRYNKNQNLIFEFVTDKSSGERAVRIIIRNNESDFTKIVISFQLFSIFAMRLKNFVANYERYCIDLPNSFLMKKILETNSELLTSIKRIPSQIVNSDQEIEVRDKYEKVDEEEVLRGEDTIEELDKYIGGSEMLNIKVPDLDRHQIEKKEIFQDIDSKFVKNVLKNDVKNLENMLNIADLSQQPIKELCNKIETEIGIEDFKMLEDIKDTEKKSLFYISKVICQTINRSYVENNTSISSSFPILKCRVDNLNEDSLSLAYDLLLFGAYFRSVRKKMEDKTKDAILNRSITYLQLRCYTDSFVFSFLGDEIKGKLSSIISSRFKSYNNDKVFDSINKIIESYDCSKVEEVDILSFIEEVENKVIGKSLYIDDLHNKLYKERSIKLPFDTSLNIEQIINEFIPLEIAEKLGRDLNNEDEILKAVPDRQISKDVLDIFMSKAKEVKPTIVKESNLFRFVNNFRNEIPPSFLEDFLNHIKEIGNNKYDLRNEKFPLEEIGENVVKALYVWDPENDKEQTSNYRHFYLLYEEEMMTKDLIISRSKESPVDEKDIAIDFNFG